MREIKFRWWSRERKALLDASTVTWKEKEEDYTNHYSQFRVNKRPQTMQCTGVKDIKGQEIWEGDIVKYSAYAERSYVMELETTHPDFDYFKGVYVDRYAEAPKSETLAVVEWMPYIPGFYVDIGPYSGERPFPYDKLEVVGNVWEHPELLDRAIEEGRRFAGGKPPYEERDKIAKRPARLKGDLDMRTTTKEK